MRQYGYFDSAHGTAFTKRPLLLAVTCFVTGTTASCHKFVLSAQHSLHNIT